MFSVAVSSSVSPFLSLWDRAFHDFCRCELERFMSSVAVSSSVSQWPGLVLRGFRPCLIRGPSSAPSILRPRHGLGALFTLSENADNGK